MSAGPRHDAVRWRRRPVLAALVKVGVFAIPILTSFAASLALMAVLPDPATALGRLGWWTAIVAAMVMSMVVFDRICRRALPLATLLGVSLAFPDRAPSRFLVLRRRGRARDLRQRLESLRDRGLADPEVHSAMTVLTLVCSLATHDRRTRGHSERVRVFADMIAEEMHVAAADRDLLLWASLLHDIGKITVDPSVLNKRGAPSESEWAWLRTHPAEGRRLVEPIQDWLGEWALAIDEHHEAYDGTGYPRGLRGLEISRAGRIVAVADAFEAMTAPRPYGRRRSAAAARDELVRHAGTQFDPEVCRAFLNLSVGRLWRTVGLWSMLGDVPLMARAHSALAGGGRLLASTGAAATTVALVAHPGSAGVQAAAHLSHPVAVVAAPAAIDPTPPRGGDAAHSPRIGVDGLSGSATPSAAPPTVPPPATPGRGSTVAPSAKPAGGDVSTTAGGGQGGLAATPRARPTPVLPEPVQPGSSGAGPPPDAPTTIQFQSLPTIIEGDTLRSAATLSGATADRHGTVDYGDGTGTQLLAVGRTAIALTHRYDQEGGYTLVVSIVDGGGRAVSAAERVTVSEANPIDMVLPHQHAAVGTHATGDGSLGDRSDDIWSIHIHP